MPVPDVYVAMADPGRLNPQQHLLALRIGVRVIPCFERLAPFNDLHCTHARSSLPVLDRTHEVGALVISGDRHSGHPLEHLDD
jgi:hypothetical protein